MHTENVQRSHSDAAVVGRHDREHALEGHQNHHVVAVGMSGPMVRMGMNLSEHGEASAARCANNGGDRVFIGLHAEAVVLAVGCDRRAEQRQVLGDFPSAQKDQAFMV
jgi:hypothetical protein